MKLQTLISLQLLHKIFAELPLFDIRHHLRHREWPNTAGETNRNRDGQVSDLAGGGRILFDEKYRDARFAERDDRCQDLINQQRRSAR